jgi:hypothetical protein
MKNINIILKVIALGAFLLVTLGIIGNDEHYEQVAYSMGYEKYQEISNQLKSENGKIPTREQVVDRYLKMNR